jgi:Leucine-rich repeat (LRR) protein
LHELALRDNAIADPPAEIGELTSLRRLDLRNNGLRSLPASVGELPHLDKLDLRWNPALEAPWLEACERRGCVIWR